MTRKIVISVIIALIILAAAAVILSVRGIGKLTEYERTLLSENGTANPHDIQRSLDEAEAFIRKHRLALGIWSYKRTGDAIEVRFMAGLSHLFQPVMDGTD